MHLHLHPPSSSVCGDTSASQNSMHADGGVGAAQATGETSKVMRRSISGGLRERATGLWDLIKRADNKKRCCMRPYREQQTTGSVKFIVPQERLWYELLPREDTGRG